MSKSTSDSSDEDSGNVIEISDDSDDGINIAGRSGVKRSYPFKESNYTIVNSSGESNNSIQCIEDESDEEPDYECNIWDKDCMVLDVRSIINKNIIGYHLMPTCTNDPENKKIEIPARELNEVFLQDLNKIKENYVNGCDVKGKDYEIFNDPWKILILSNLLKDYSILNYVRQEFYESKWNFRKIDLYEFFQSEDLSKVNTPYISMVYKFLCNDLKDWVEMLTGLELYKVSATCSYYGDTDFLLVHDDLQEDRAVAFVLYLDEIENWSADWGGNLELFAKDEAGLPTKCDKKILPKNNQLVLFPVSPSSYHQVEEVRSKNFCRLSINGWFHSKNLTKFKLPEYVKPKKGIFSLNYDLPVENKIDLSKWIVNEYLENQTAGAIQSYIEQHSEMSLAAYFEDEKIEEITSLISNDDINWKIMGPSNKRQYEYIADVSSLPESLREFVEIFQSQSFFLILKQYTNLDVAKMKWELQRWTNGSYMLIDEQNANRLDLFLYFGDVNIIGGKTNYVTLEDIEQCALITISPEHNHLNLVYGDIERYTSLISQYSKSKYMYAINCAYYED